MRGREGQERVPARLAASPVCASCVRRCWGLLFGLPGQISQSSLFPAGIMTLRVCACAVKCCPRSRYTHGGGQGAAGSTREWPPLCVLHSVSVCVLCAWICIPHRTYLPCLSEPAALLIEAHMHGLSLPSPQGVPLPVPDRKWLANHLKTEYNFDTGVIQW